MLFILIVWLLVLLTFTIWLRALHSIPIYTHNPLELESQTLQIQSVWHVTQMLFALALACISLHFVLPTDVVYLPTHNMHINTSINASVLAHTYNSTS